MRRIALRAFAALSALCWIVVPGFGAIDLSVTWDPDWPQVLEAGWGLYFTVLVGAGFVLAAVRPRASPAGVVQLAVATGALAVAAMVGAEAGLAVVAAALAVQTLIVAALARPDWPPPVRPNVVSLPLLLLAAAAIVPWLVYAFHMWALNREERFDSDITNGIDHYSVQGALALALAVLPVLAAVRSGLRPFVPLCAGAVACYLGLVSLAWPDAAGALGTAWSAATMAWGAALLGVAMVTHHTARAAANR
jgi:hypothetical protein